MGEHRRLGVILVEDYRVLPEDLDRAISAQRYVPDRIGTLLVRMGVLTERDLVTALAQQRGCSVVLGLPKLSIPLEVLQLVPLRVAERKLVIPVSLVGQGSSQRLVVAMADPTDSVTVDALERLTGFEVVPAIAPEEDVRRALKVFYFEDPSHRDMEEVSTSMEMIRAHMHERTSSVFSHGSTSGSIGSPAPMFEPEEVGSTAA